MNILKYAFKKSIPVLCSYIFLGMAYGILMEKAGFGWYYSLFISLVVYTGAFQFVLTTLHNYFCGYNVFTQGSCIRILPGRKENACLA